MCVCLLVCLCVCLFVVYCLRCSISLSFVGWPFVVLFCVFCVFGSSLVAVGRCWLVGCCLWFAVCCVARGVLFDRVLFAVVCRCSLSRVCCVLFVVFCLMLVLLFAVRCVSFV